MEEFSVCEKCKKQFPITWEESQGDWINRLCPDCDKVYAELSRKLYNDFIQPERSKREDLSCCEKVKWLKEQIALRPNHSPFADLNEELLAINKMRCSEHGG